MLSSVTPAAACYELLRLRRSKYTRGPHEQTVPNTQAVLHSILDFIREDELSLALTDEYRLELQVDGTDSGNPLRFEEGKVQLRLDAEWKGSLKSTGAYLVKALSWTPLHRYGYMGRELE